MAQGSFSLDQLRAKLRNPSPLDLAIGLGALSFVGMIVGTCAAYSDDGPLPAPRPAPPSAEKAAVASYRYKETFYHAVIDEDCAKFGVAKSSLEQMKAVHPYRTEFDGSQRLRVGRALNTKSLAIKATKRRLWIGAEGQSMRARHWVLRITNRTDKPLAYRVTTRVSGSCAGKGSLPHNALAILPGKTVERAECLLRKTRIKIERVEVVELSPLGYHYISRLDPDRLQHDERTSAGHDYGKRSPCRMIPWRRIRQDLKNGDATWVDILDFYARHNCDEYIYYSGYRRPTEPLEHLPAKAPEAK